VSRRTDTNTPELLIDLAARSIHRVGGTVDEEQKLLKADEVGEIQNHDERSLMQFSMAEETSAFTAKASSLSNPPVHHCTSSEENQDNETSFAGSLSSQVKPA
jgi:hypothetical protein